MPLTHHFRDTVQARAQADGRFRRALFVETNNELLTGDLAAGKAMLRDYVNTTIGFERLADEVGRPAKSLQRMLGPSGNPTAEELIAILKVLQVCEAEQTTVKLSEGAS